MFSLLQLYNKRERKQRTQSELSYRHKATFEHQKGAEFPSVFFCLFQVSYKKNNHQSLQLDHSYKNRAAFEHQKGARFIYFSCFLFFPKKKNPVSLLIWTKHYFRGSKMMLGFLLCSIFSFVCKSDQNFKK